CARRPPFADLYYASNLEPFMFRSLLAFTLLAASTAFGQQQMVCGGNPGPPTLIRAEGLAERVSEIVPNCTGGQAGATYAGSLALFLGDLYPPPLYGLNPSPTTVDITGRLSPGSNYSEAVLLVGDVSTNPVVGVNVFQGVQSGANAVAFNNLT